MPELPDVEGFRRVCKTKLKRATVAGRTTYWCPSCQ
jgi:formamidopyrimidine-DNA glycosylase